MVESLYVMQRLAEEKWEDQLRLAEQRRLIRSASEASRPSSAKRFLAWILDARATRPTPRRA